GDGPFGSALRCLLGRNESFPLRGLFRPPHPLGIELELKTRSAARGAVGVSRRALFGLETRPARVSESTPESTSERLATSRPPCYHYPNAALDQRPFQSNEPAWRNTTSPRARWIYPHRTPRRHRHHRHPGRVASARLDQGQDARPAPQLSQ